MPEEKSGYHIQGEPPHKPPIQPPLQMSGDEQSPTPPTNGNAPDNNETVKELEKIEAGERWLIGIGIATLLINTLIAWIYYGQLKEMVGSSGATDELIRISRRQIDQLSRQAQETHQLAEQAKIQAEASKKIATNAAVQASANKTAAEAAKDSADIATASIRPWIKINDLELRQGAGDIKTLMFHFSESGIRHFPQLAGKEFPPQLQLHLKFENVGHTPSIDSDVEGEIFFHKFDGSKWHDDVIKEERRFCSSVLTHAPGGSASIIFPSESSERFMVLTGFVPGDAITMDEGRRFSSAAVIVCVNYRGTSKTLHQTQAWYGLYEDNKIAIPIGVDVDSDKLRLIRENNGDQAK